MIINTILTLGLMVSCQIAVYVVFLRSRILTWGASNAEVNMPLVGDELAPTISATRAISIKAPMIDVWNWITQLGADRGGFFSYAFLERALGYEMRSTNAPPEFQGIAVGRVIPGSIDESKSVIKYNFPVIAVDPGKSFVIKEWGTFALQEISPTHTRLIVRTHGRELPNLLSQMNEFIGMPLHYIMERRMLMGFKSHAETGAKLSATPDNLWIFGMLASAIGLCLLALIGDGIQAILLTVAYGIMWLFALLIVNPRQPFGIILLLIIAITTITLV